MCKDGAAPVRLLKGKMKREAVLEVLKSEKHFIKKCEAVSKHQKKMGFSEREVALSLGISKSHAHRMLVVGRADALIKKACIKYGTDYYAIVALYEAPVKVVGYLAEKILSGEVRKHVEAKNIIMLYRDIPKT
jgi:hypothetical protein